MLIEFSVGNYRSFKERGTLSMEAAEIASQPPSLDANNVFVAGPNLHLLTSAAIYGANASGKSNLILALRFMRRQVLGSSRETQIGEQILVEPFQLSTSTASKPSEFEVVFLVDDIQYRYGFIVSTTEVIKEWLYRLGSKREATLFERSLQTITVKPAFREGRKLDELTRPNALFLSVVAQFNGQIAASILNWFKRLGLNTGISDVSDMMEAFHHFEQSTYRPLIEGFIQRFDVGIDGLALERTPAAPPPNLPSDVAEAAHAFFERLSQNESPPENLSIKTSHKRFDAEGQPEGVVHFDLQQHESAGTGRLFALAYPIVRALAEGFVLVVDELDARIHPNLVIELIRLFNDPATNPRHAQLIFTTHNTNLLSAKLFRRDQVWFVEKSRQGASDLYSLVEYRADGKIIRNDASFEKDYIAGRYGAVPFIGDLGALLGVEYEQQAKN